MAFGKKSSENQESIQFRRNVLPPNGDYEFHGYEGTEEIFYADSKPVKQIWHLQSLFRSLFSVYKRFDHFELKILEAANNMHRSIPLLEVTLDPNSKILPPMTSTSMFNVHRSSLCKSRVLWSCSQ